MDSAIICNTTQENIHKYRYEKNKYIKIKCAIQYTVDLINNNINRDVQTGCTGVYT